MKNYVIAKPVRFYLIMSIVITGAFYGGMYALSEYVAWLVKVSA